MNITVLANLAVALWGAYAAGESFAAGNRKGGWVCLVVAGVNAAAVALTLCLSA